MTIAGLGAAPLNALLNPTQAATSETGRCALDFFSILAGDLTSILVSVPAGTAAVAPTNPTVTGKETDGNPLQPAGGIEAVELNPPEVVAFLIRSPQVIPLGRDETMGNDIDIADDDVVTEDAALPLPSGLPAQPSVPVLPMPASSTVTMATPPHQKASFACTGMLSPALGDASASAPGVTTVQRIRPASAKAVAFQLEIAESTCPQITQTKPEPQIAAADHPITKPQPELEPAAPRPDTLPPVKQTAPEDSRPKDKNGRMPSEESRTASKLPATHLSERAERVDPVRQPHASQTNPTLPLVNEIKPAAASVPFRSGSTSDPSAAGRLDPPVTLAQHYERPAAPREFIIQLPAALDKTVQVHLVERAGHVKVTVRCSDPQITTALRSDLGDLVRSLTSKGYQIDAWAPPETHPLAVGGLATLPSGETFTGEQPQDGGTPYRHPNWDSEQQQHRSRERWLDELERRLEEE